MDKTIQEIRMRQINANNLMESGAIATIEIDMWIDDIQHLLDKIDSDAKVIAELAQEAENIAANIPFFVTIRRWVVVKSIGRGAEMRPDISGIS